MLTRIAAAVAASPFILLAGLSAIVWMDQSFPMDPEPWPGIECYAPDDQFSQADKETRGCRNWRNN